MSSKYVGAVFDFSPYAGAAFAIHLALGDIANDTHNDELWVSTAKLAEKARANEKTVRRTLQLMVEDGLLVLLEKRPGRSDLYRFIPPGQETRADNRPGPPGQETRGGRTRGPRTPDNRPDERKKHKRTTTKRAAPLHSSGSGALPWFGEETG